MDTATLDRTTTEDVLRFIDEWLDDNGWKVDGGALDFALDVRRLVVALGEDAALGADAAD